MIDFTAIILFCLLALGVSFRVGNMRKYEKKEGATGLEAVSKKEPARLILAVPACIGFRFYDFLLVHNDAHLS